MSLGARFAELVGGILFLAFLAGYVVIAPG